MIQTTRIISFCILVNFFPIVSAQEGNGNSDYLSWFDTTIGIENTPLFEGLGYVEQFESINERHKFFTSEDFLSGSMAYDGQEYHRLKLKYDIASDEVILNLKEGLEVIALQPDKKKISSFSIEGSDFENIGVPDVSNPEISGFFEILFSVPTFTLLKKHQKKRSQKIGDFVYYEFRDDNFHVLLYDGSYYLVDSNRDFRKLFPKFKKDIRKYKIKKSDKDNGMKALLKRLYLLMSKENVQ